MYLELACLTECICEMYTLHIACGLYVSQTVFIVPNGLYNLQIPFMTCMP
jgi:hypothetical protein